MPAFIPLVLISFPNLFLFNICSDSNLINSNFFNCNFNFSATSWTLNSSSGVPGSNNLDFKDINGTKISDYIKVFRNYDISKILAIRKPYIN